MSVDSTSATTGKISVNWLNPEQIDTVGKAVDHIAEATGAATK